jgi:glutathione S-transferase
MTITLWGRPSSSNVQKVRWALEELELPYDSIKVGGTFGGLNDADFVAMNPNRLVPVLRDGDLTLWESHAILRYLAAQYGSGLLWPVDPTERAIVDQWTDWCATTFLPAWSQVFWLAWRTPEAQRDQGKIDAALEAAGRQYRILEARLAQAPFVGGSTFTYADIAAGISMHRWTTMPIQRPELPNVAAWHARLRERAGYRTAVEVSYDDLKGRLSF